MADGSVAYERNANSAAAERRISNQELEAHAARHLMVYDAVNEEFLATDQNVWI